MVFSWYCRRGLLCLGLTVLALTSTVAVAEPLVTNCLIEPNQIVEVGSPVTGVLKTVLVARADLVREGQVLAELESSAEEASAELAAFKSRQVGPTQLAQSKIEFAEKQFQRRRTMAAEGVMATSEKDQAEADLKSATAELTVASENRESARLEYVQQDSLLKLRSIKSPFNGVVVDQVAHPGELVGPSVGKGVVLKLAQLNPLQVRAVLPKRVFGQIKTGMKVDVLPEIPAGARYAAKVKSVDRLVDAASGTFVVLLELPNPQLTIPAGVTCKAHFVGGGQ